jgi:large subunit ribosomal protein L18
MEIKQKRRIQRKARVRSRVYGTSERPRLSVFKSLGHIYGQLIDDNAQKTLVSASDLISKKKTEGTKQSPTKKVESAGKVGEELAKKAVAKKIKKVVFDRNGYRFHGRVKELAEGARKGGLEF